MPTFSIEHQTLTSTIKHHQTFSVKLTCCTPSKKNTNITQLTSTNNNAFYETPPKTTYSYINNLQHTLTYCTPSKTNARYSLLNINKYQCSPSNTNNTAFSVKCCYINRFQ